MRTRIALVVGFFAIVTVIFIALLPGPFFNFGQNFTRDLILETPSDVPVCNVFGFQYASAVLCDAMRTMILFGIVAVSLIIGLIVGLYLFRNEIRAALKRWMDKTPT